MRSTVRALGRFQMPSSLSVLFFIFQSLEYAYKVYPLAVGYLYLA